MELQRFWETAPSELGALFRHPVCTDVERKLAVVLREGRLDPLSGALLMGRRGRIVAGKVVRTEVVGLNDWLADSPDSIETIALVKNPDGNSEQLPVLGARNIIVEISGVIYAVERSPFPPHQIRRPIRMKYQEPFWHDINRIFKEFTEAWGQ